MSKECILLSYPRCGNTWFRQAIEYITNIETWPTVSGEEFREQNNLNNLRKDYYILRKEHSLYDDEVDTIDAIVEKENIYRKSKLILLLRNYRDVITRHRSDQEGINKLLTEFHDASNRNIFNYMENLIEFDNWPENKRLLIYYEDLMETPKEAFNRAIDFLECESNLQKFYDNYDKVFSSSKKSYTKRHESYYNNRNIIPINATEWDSCLKEKYPELFEKYLKRYAGDSTPNG